jgi:hypothetical protein
MRELMDMKIACAAFAAAALVGSSGASAVLAQVPPGGPPPGGGPRRPPPTPVSQVQEYKTSMEEYLALKAKAGGGTRQTAATLPDWRGVWQRQPRGPLFSFDDTGPPNLELPGYATPTAVLTPKYKADWEREVADVKAGREWDRLSYCLPAGFPRWLTEPWLREFIPTPDETWLTHEQINETRRVYTDGRDHVADADTVPLWLGDSIGFWAGDTLVIHTNHIKAGTYQRGQPAYSYQTSTVEQWRKTDPDTMEVKITVYDPPALVKPWHAVFHYVRVKDPKIRVNYDACEENNNTVRRPDGGSTFIFPGDPGYHDPETFGVPEVTWDTLPK